MLPIRVLAEGSYLRPDPLDQEFSLSRFSDFNHLLDHVIRVLILHHEVQGILVRPVFV